MRNFFDLVIRFRKFFCRLKNILAKKLADSLHDTEFQHWINIISAGRKCESQIKMAQDCKKSILNMDIVSIIKLNATDFDGIRNEVSKGIFFFLYNTMV